MTTADRIGRYIGKIPGAVSGNGGHPRTFKVAMVLFNGFGCSEAETLEWLRHYNSKCEPPWSEAELLHKARSAAEAAYDKPRGWMLTSKRFSHVRLQVPVFPGKSCPVARHGCHGSFPLQTQLRGDLYTHKRDTPELARGSESTVANVAATGDALRNRDATDETVRSEPVEPNPTENSADLNGARRIADELLKLHRDGATKGPTDASFYANLIHTFGATYTKANSSIEPSPTEPDAHMWKSDLDSVCAEVLDEVRARGWEPGLTEGSYHAIVRTGFRHKSLPLAFVATDVLAGEQPNTLRQLFYRLVSKASSAPAAFEPNRKAAKAARNAHGLQSWNKSEGKPITSKKL